MAEVAHFDAVTADVQHVALPSAESVALQRLQRFTQVVEAVVSDHAIAERLANAGVQVRIVLSDLPSQPVTLELMAPAATVRRGYVDTAPDVQLRMSSADLEDVLLKRSYLPMRVLAGEVEFVGCIRKLLRVIPVLSAAAVEADRRLERQPVRAL